MSDLIDREAAKAFYLKWICEEDDGNSFAHALDSLPAAVLLCDVEKAARALSKRLQRGNGFIEYAPYEDCKREGRAEYEADARAILSAGYVGSVSVEDVRTLALYWLGKRNWTVMQLDAAANRLLAATEGK